LAHAAPPDADLDDGPGAAAAYERSAATAAARTAVLRSVRAGDALPGPQLVEWMDAEIGDLRGEYEGEIRTLEVTQHTTTAHHAFPTPSIPLFLPRCTPLWS